MRQLAYYIYILEMSPILNLTELGPKKSMFKNLKNTFPLLPSTER